MNCISDKWFASELNVLYVDWASWIQRLRSRYRNDVVEEQCNSASWLHTQPEKIHVLFHDWFQQPNDLRWMGLFRWWSSVFLVVGGALPFAPSGPQVTGSQLCTHISSSPPGLYIFIDSGLSDCVSSVSHRAQPTPEVCVNIVTSTLQNKDIKVWMMICCYEADTT